MQQPHWGQRNGWLRYGYIKCKPLGLRHASSCPLHNFAKKSLEKVYDFTKKSLEKVYDFAEKSLEKVYDFAKKSLEKV